MEFFRTAVLRLSVPLNIVLSLWVSMGPGFFGNDLFIFDIFFAAFLLVLFGSTSKLEFCQAGRPIRLTAAQAVAQTVVWLAMLAFGLTVVALGEPGTQASLLTRWFGDGLLALSRVIAGGSFLVGVAVWVVLLVLLLRGVRKTQPA